VNQNDGRAQVISEVISHIVNVESNYSSGQSMIYRSVMRYRIKRLIKLVVHG